MLRNFLIGLSKAKWAQSLVTHWKFAWRFASRFIAGQTLVDAVEVVRQLNASGLNATLDQLGENTTSEKEAVSATLDVLEIIKTIHLHQLRCNVSVKLSQLGLVIDEELCRKNMRDILEAASSCKSFVRIDMEDSSLTEKTIGIYLWAKESGFDNVGIVIQSYLYRSLADIQHFSGLFPKVRLCKGAYKEPAGLAFPKKEQVDENYDKLVSLLLEISKKNDYPVISQDGHIPPIPALATHDPKRIAFALSQIEKNGIPKMAVEFQMLFGIRRDLQEKLVSEGYPVRIYVPFGTHWYPYFMRRLAERPANLWFFLVHFFRK
jgi:proline dehydrogenase